MRRRRSGLSLLESLVAAGLLALLTGMALMFLVPSLRMSTRSGLRVEMQQQASVLLERLQVDLEHSAPAGVALLPGRDATQMSGISIQALQGFTSLGAQVWEPKVIAYVWLPGPAVIKRETWTPSLSPSLPVMLMSFRPSRLTYQDLITLSNDPSNPEVVVARGVQLLEVNPGPSGMGAVVIHLVLQREVPGRSTPERLEVRRGVMLRNQA